MSNQMKKWAKAAGMRAIKTGAETAIAGIGTAMLVTDVHWAAVASMTALAMVLSVLASVKGLPEVEDGASVASLSKAGE